MADKREDIMNRLEAIAATVTGVVTVQRNKGLLTDAKRPAIVILDGDEDVDLVAAPRGRGPQMTKTINRAKPEIYLLLKEYRSNSENKDGVNVGTLLNTMRIEIVKKIAADATLRALLGANGGIDYTGCITDLKSGSALAGEMRLDFTFSYVFDPNAN